jgi:flagellar basal body P-ring formation protein FlgA
VSAGEIEPGVRLRACRAPLETFSRDGAPLSGRMSIGVRCPRRTSWTVYVPVIVEVEAPVLVLRRSLPRRARIAATDVEPQVRRFIGLTANYLSDIASLQHHRLKRALPAGTALTVDVLIADILLRKGQRVTLIAAATEPPSRAAPAR